MKERYNVEISDIQLTIVSDEPEDFVNATVEKISERIDGMLAANKRCSKLDAALLCALDYCGEYQKAERRIRNLEAQISLYDANLKRLREELASRGDAPERAKTELGVASASAPKKDAPAADKKDDAPKARAPRDAKAPEDTDTVNMLETEAPAEAPAADDAKRASARSKLEEIEMLLRRSND